MPIFLRRILVLVRQWRRGDELSLRIVKLVLAAVLVDLAFGCLFYRAEVGMNPDLTLEDSLWWAVVTTTTVGYGDYFPVTFAGRYLVALPLMILGIGLIGSLVGLVADLILDHSSRKRKGLMKTKAKDHFIICNYPGTEKLLSIIEELEAAHPSGVRHPVVLITESLEELPAELAAKEVHFVRGNSTSEQVLLQANLLESRGVLILARDTRDVRCDERSFAIATVIETLSRQAGVAVITTVELVSPQNLDMMKRSGVDRIVSTADIGTSLLVQEMFNAGLQRVFSQLASNRIGSRFELVPARFPGKTLAELQRASIDRELEAQIVGVVRGEGKHMLSARSTVVQEGDLLMVLTCGLNDCGKLDTGFH